MFPKLGAGSAVDGLGDQAGRAVFVAQGFAAAASGLVWRGGLPGRIMSGCTPSPISSIRCTLFRPRAASAGWDIFAATWAPGSPSGTTCDTTSCCSEVLERRKKIYDRITPIEADIPIHKRLVIVQAESLDTNMLGYKVNGVAVTPFLESACAKSRCTTACRRSHCKRLGHADFATLTGVPGSQRANTYAIPGYPYENTTPQVLADCGYNVFSFHGNSGEFYSRRAAFEKMGFTDIYFREELEGRYGLPGHGLGRERRRSAAAVRP